MKNKYRIKELRVRSFNGTKYYLTSRWQVQERSLFGWLDYDWSTANWSEAKEKLEKLLKEDELMKSFQATVKKDRKPRFFYPPLPDTVDE